MSPSPGLEKDGQLLHSVVGGRLQESFGEAEKEKPEGTTAGSALTVMSTAGPDSAL